jgi:hypothetical protein
MRLVTESECRLWMLHKGPRFMRQRSTLRPDINVIVNKYEPPRHYAVHASNTTNLLRTMSRRMGVRAALVQMLSYPSPPSDPRRVRRCFKWAARLREVSR